MAGNHLEQLVAEWYEYRGYFVRRNIKVGLLPGGGFASELDIVAIDPESRKVVHVEPSLDADAWEKREKRFRKKFELGQKHVPTMFKGWEVKSIEQIALIGFGSDANHEVIGGGKVVLVRDFLKEVIDGLKGAHIGGDAVTENYPLLRTLVFVKKYNRHLFPRT